MPVNRSGQGKPPGKPQALNSVKKPSNKSGKALTKKRSSKKPASPVSVNSGFSLYSSDTESGGVSSLNHGLDRCAALLANILDEDDSIVQHYVGSKEHPLKKTKTEANHQSKGKLASRNATKTPKQIQHAKKTQQKQGNTTNKLGCSTQDNTRRTITKSSGRPLASESMRKGTLAPKAIIQEIQSPQFNDRLVSSTPDMGSPTSDTHNPNRYNEAPRQPIYQTIHRETTHQDDTHNPNRFNEVPSQPINPTPHPVNTTPHRDASLEALAAQIRMLRSQAEMAEAAQQQGPENIPVKGASHLGGILQEQTYLKPQIVQYEMVDEPGQIVRNLADRLRVVNTRNQVTHSDNMIPQHHSLHPETLSQFKQHQVPHNQHQFPVLPPTEAKASAKSGQKSTVSTAPFESRESRNTSIVGEYHQLPDGNIRPSGSSEQILNQLKEIETVIPTPHLNTLHSIGHNPESTQSNPFINQNKIKYVPTNQVKSSPSPMRPSYPSGSPQSRTIQVADHHICLSETTPSRTTQLAPQKMCMGTQTYSPPADKGVQTSTISSPSSPDITPSPSSSDDKCSSDTDSNKNALLRGNSEANLPDTPHPQPRFSSERRSASWEQMRVLRFLLGELRAAIGVNGEDREIQRLITEMQECMDTLQYLPPDLQAEIGLALQPLRSENSQLRRRLRIANQQIRQLQNGPDKENVEPPIDVEVLTLQSLTAKLQKDLRDVISERKTLADSNSEYMTTIETMKQKHCDLMMLLQQKDAHQLDSRKEWLEEKSALNNQMDEMQSQLNDLHLRIEMVNKENKILQFSLKQRNSEILRLKENINTIYPESKSHFLAKDIDSISESDDDDVTPTASPHQTPLKTQDPIISTTTRTLVTDTYPNQNFTKRVTFAQYISPKQTENGVGIPRRNFKVTLHGDVNNDKFRTSQPYSDLLGLDRYKELSSDDASEDHSSEDIPTGDHTRFNGTYPAHGLEAVADKDFSMRTFLEHSRRFISDESERESSDIARLQQPASNKYELNRTSTNQRDLFEKVSKSHQRSHLERQHHDRTRTHSFPSDSTQDDAFQGSVLNGSDSSIDCTSTQSSVTSQYEAQFQLGLANLDSEIAKLQSSLKYVNQT